MKTSTKHYITIGAAALLIIGIFAPLVHVPAFGNISFWSANSYKALSGINTQIAGILMIICAAGMIGLTLASIKIPVLNFHKTIGIAGILVLVIPLMLVLPQQIMAYYDRMTSKTPHWLQSVGDTVSSAGGSVGMKAVHFQWGLYVFAIAVLGCFVIGILKLLKKM